MFLFVIFKFLFFIFRLSPCSKLCFFFLLLGFQNSNAEFHFQQCLRDRITITTGSDKHVYRHPSVIFKVFNTQVKLIAISNHDSFASSPNYNCTLKITNSRITTSRLFKNSYFFPFFTQQNFVLCNNFTVIFPFTKRKKN